MLKNVNIFQDGEFVFIQITTDKHKNEYAFNSWDEAIEALPNLDEML